MFIFCQISGNGQLLHATHHSVHWLVVLSITGPASCTSSLKRDCPPCDISIRKGIIPHGFHNFIVAFSSIYFSLTLWLFWSSHAVLVELHQLCATFALQLSFYRPLFYNSKAHCYLLQCLGTTSAILTGENSYFVTSFMN